MSNKTFYVGIPADSSGSYFVEKSADAYAGSNAAARTKVGSVLSSTFQTFTINTSSFPYVYIVKSGSTSAESLWHEDSTYKDSAIPLHDSVETNVNYVFDDVRGDVFRIDPCNTNGGGTASSASIEYIYTLSTDNASSQTAKAYAVYVSGSSTYVSASDTATAAASANVIFPDKYIDGSSNCYYFWSMKVYNGDAAPSSDYSVPSDTKYIARFPTSDTASLSSGAGKLDQTIPTTPGQVTISFTSASTSTEQRTGGNTEAPYSPGASSTYNTLAAIQLNTSNGGIAFNLANSDGDAGATGDFWATNVVNVSMPSGNPNWTQVFEAFKTAIIAKGSTGTGDFGVVSATSPDDIHGTGTIQVTYVPGVETDSPVDGVINYGSGAKPVLQQISGARVFNSGSVNPVSAVLNQAATITYDFVLTGSSTQCPATGSSNLANAVTSTIAASAGNELQAGGTSASPVANLKIATGSLSAETEIGLSIAGENDPQKNGLRDAGANGASYSKMIRVTPHGTTFSSAAEISFNLEGSVEGTCPSDLQIWKRGSADGPWYRLPNNLWTCASGKITINTTSFSDYQALGGQIMARTKLNNIQLKRLEEANKILPDSINITGSNTALVTTVVDSDVFILQKANQETSQHVSASTLQTYFSTLSVENSSEDVDMYLTFVSGAGSQAINIDGGVSGSTLRYNPSHDLLSAKNVHFGGYITAAGAISGSSTLSIGGASELEGTLNVEGAVDFDSTLNVDGTATLATVDINAGNIDGTAIGAASQSTAKFTTISGSSTLNVGGAAELDSTLRVRQAATFDGAISGSSTLIIAGASELEGTLNVEGAVDFDSTLNVDGTATLATVDINAGNIDGTAIGAASQSTAKFTTISGSSTLNVGGAAELDSTLRVRQAATFDGAISGSSTLSVKGASELEGTLNVEGAVDFDSTLNVDGAVTIAGNLTVKGTTTQIDTQNLLVEDPIIVLADGNGEATVDQGLVFTRGGVANQMFLWDESADQFALVVTSEDGTTSGSVSISNYTAVRTGNLIAGTISGSALTATSISGSSTLSVGGAAELEGTLNVEGAASLDSTLSVGGTATMAAISGSSTLSIAGASELEGTLNVEGAATFDGAISGSSTLSIAGASELEGTLNVEGAVDFDSTLNVDGTATLATVDINGGNIDGTAIGAASQSTAKFTTISGSSTLSVGGAAELDSTLRVRQAATFDGAISGSSTLSIAGASELEGTLNVEGAVDFDSTLNVDGTATLATVDINGGNIDGTAIGAASQSTAKFTTISGSSTLSVGGAAELDSTLRVRQAATFDGAISGSSTLSIAGASELEGTLNVEGAVDLDSTLNVDGAVTLGSVADLSISVGDETHYMVVQDSDNNIIKRATLASFITASAAALGAGDGIQVSNGQLSVQFRELIATRYSTGSVLSDDYVTASFPSGEEPLSGSLQVYLNGMLLVATGAVEIVGPGGDADPIFDYYFLGSAGSRRVEFVSAVDPDDVIQIKYIRK